jgi:hypothetical protein
MQYPSRGHFIKDLLEFVSNPHFTLEFHKDKRYFMLNDFLNDIVFLNKKEYENEKKEEFDHGYEVCKDKLLERIENL